MTQIISIYNLNKQKISNCFSERRKLRYCNSLLNLPLQDDLWVSDGFIHNPGYPRFYTGDECKWTINAPRHQNIRITILDLSIVSKDEHGCVDHVEVKDSGQTVYSSCENDQLPVNITTKSETAEVIFNRYVLI